ncbi:MAG: hypothetical protein EOS73_24340 [Mesorhizobium sp.]|uniref:hypothetical protein n=1 Tax=Mesorhizobium sp. M7A.F.Ca.ET.027.02.1.1 TaxID=2496655 RepID=UPI000FD58407|nr:hypothetical protein [Mesorhizobium sp. M7A.F.Ca.ET.027.02.1.1]RVD06650.1 hypothetical protein EN749_34800 [Mesorhizobium sp. M7A.F.Ca.ET.027.02.1.1]RWC25369.1 MAG: hypothetical protein EOS27_28755 [Mesorhizobium sp.]RWD01357.1 MAG: hypothetical protein EOS73_24340 [Mesorhizobium sp.]
MLIQARGELDARKRKKLYADMGQIVRDEGGVIIPMFNNFTDATGWRLGRGWQPGTYGRLRAIHDSRPEALRP